MSNGTPNNDSSSMKKIRSVIADEINRMKKTKEVERRGRGQRNMTSQRFLS